VAGEEFVELTSESRVAQNRAKFDFLNEEGKAHLEFILMYLHKKQNIKTGYILVHVA